MLPFTKSVTWNARVVSAKSETTKRIMIRVDDYIYRSIRRPELV